MNYKLGQIVYVFTYLNSAVPQIEKATVEKVGRKYITVKRGWTSLEFEMGKSQNGVIKLPRRNDGYQHNQYLFISEIDAQMEKDRFLLALSMKDRFTYTTLLGMDVGDLMCLKNILNKYGVYV